MISSTRRADDVQVGEFISGLAASKDLCRNRVLRVSEAALNYPSAQAIRHRPPPQNPPAPIAIERARYRRKHDEKDVQSEGESKIRESASFC
jgi:hypothetical protein